MKKQNVVVAATAVAVLTVVLVACASLREQREKSLNLARRDAKLSPGTPALAIGWLDNVAANGDPYDDNRALVPEAEVPDAAEKEKAARAKAEAEEAAKRPAGTP